MPGGFGGGPENDRLVGALWTQIGPAPLRSNSTHAGVIPEAGRVNDLAVDPRNDSTIYIACVGGIWKSRDGGSSWQPKTNWLPCTSMAAVMIDPWNPSRIFAGAESPINTSSLFCSIDEGETWSVIGGDAMLGKNVVRIVSATPDVILVATKTGLFRSTGGGMNFDNAPVIPDRIWDLHVDTRSPSTVYACIDRQGIFKSTDGGATFPAANNLFQPANGAPAAGTYGPVTMAQSTMPDAQTFYASISIDAWHYKGLYKSTTGGSSWVRQVGAPDVSGPTAQLDYNQTVGVDPQNPDLVYLGFVNLYARSSHDDMMFQMVSNGWIHQDHHAIGFSPRSHPGGPTPVYVGTDGGLAKSTDGGNSWTCLNEGVGTILIGGRFGLDIGRASPGNNQYSYAGTQDNGVVMRQPRMSGTDWKGAGLGGDGAAVAVDHSDPHVVYATVNSYPTPLNKTVNGGGNPSDWTSISGVSEADWQNWPVTIHPNRWFWRGILYVGANKKLFQLIQILWFRIQRVISPQSPDTPFNNEITCLAMVPGDRNTVWVGLIDGTVWYTSNALDFQFSSLRQVRWQQSGAGQLPTGRKVTSIAVDPRDPRRVVVGYDGFSGTGAGNRSQHIYLTTGGGGVWVDRSGTDGAAVAGSNVNQGPPGNLPDEPVFSVVIDSDSTIVVGTQTSVWYSRDSGASWSALGVGLPSVPCVVLALDSARTPSLIRVGTWGRSVFELVDRTTTGGPKIAVVSNLAFGRVSIPFHPIRLTAKVFNVGTDMLTINNITRIAGSTAFSIAPDVELPITIPPGENREVAFQFQPSSPGDQTAVFNIGSNDSTTPSIPLSGTGVPIWSTPTPQFPGSPLPSPHFPPSPS